MSNNERPRGRRNAFRPAILPLFALLFVLLQSGPASAQSQWTTSEANISNTNPGNVGVGTTAPQTKLDLVGVLTIRDNAASGGFKVRDRATDPGRQLVFSAAVGSPYSVFNTFVQGSTLTTPKLSQFSAWTSDIDANAANSTQFLFRHDPVRGGIISTIAYGTATAKKISFQPNWDDRSTPTALVINTDGNVGIGTDSPATKLHVAGDITVTGNINAKYQDIAEWVPSRQLLSAGTVVVLDPDHSNHVLGSSESYDTRVAGVVSAQPGLSLGESGEGKVLVATTGRVKVRVDATHAPIHIGDLLVTSDAAGAAMKSEPVAVGGRKMHAPGTIIGKALEPLEKGTGEILVLLSLQ